MYNIKPDNKTVRRVEIVTFAELEMSENDIEEILRSNIEMICDDEESMLIVGRQVTNEQGARSDLTAIDNTGSMVLIEIKRDRKDIEARKEAFEFQAIRYAASYATIDSPEELVSKIYAPYIEKYEHEFELGKLTPHEQGSRKLNEFLVANDADKSFNLSQRIVLIASGFDEQTLSAVAWLNRNGVDISCYTIKPYKLDEEVFVSIEKILPLAEYTDFYVNLLDKSAPKYRKKITKRTLPKIADMLEWGVVKDGDTIQAKGREDESTLLANGNVMTENGEMSMQVWLREIYGWSSVHTYVFAVHKESGKTLAEIRQRYMEDHGMV